jgi:hypothetical protein
LCYEDVRTLGPEVHELCHCLKQVPLQNNWHKWRKLISATACYKAGVFPKPAAVFGLCHTNKISVKQYS